MTQGGPDRADSLGIRFPNPLGDEQPDRVVTRLVLDADGPFALVEVANLLNDLETVYQFTASCVLQALEESADRAFAERRRQLSGRMLSQLGRAGLTPEQCDAYVGVVEQEYGMTQALGQAVPSPYVGLRSGSLVIELVQLAGDAAWPATVMTLVAGLLKHGENVAAWPGRVKAAWYKSQAEAETAVRALQRIRLVGFVDEGVQISIEGDVRHSRALDDRNSSGDDEATVVD
jgi:hypothetical protein